MACNTTLASSDSKATNTCRQTASKLCATKQTIQSKKKVHCIWQYGLLLFSESSLLCFFFYKKKKNSKSLLCLDKNVSCKISDISCRGEFEMQRREKLPNSCYGMQAHLSTNASPKVLEVVLKLPQKIILEEVPRLSAWPT